MLKTKVEEKKMGFEWLRFVSPVAEARYAWLSKPDTKFKQTGVYRIECYFKPEDIKPIITELNTQLKKFIDEKVAEHTSKNRIDLAQKVTAKINPFWTEEIGHDGNKTGLIKMNFKKDAVRMLPDGSARHQQINVFDANNQKIFDQIMLGNGSLVKVAFATFPYHVGTTGTGISLVLDAVQIIKHVPYNSGGSDASNFGFAPVEGGYSYSQSSNNTPDFGVPSNNTSNDVPFANNSTPPVFNF